MAGRSLGDGRGLFCGFCVRLRLAQMLLSHFDVGLPACVIIGNDELGHFFVRFGGHLQVLGNFAVVLLGLEWGGHSCRCGRCFIVECHGKNFQ